MTITWPVLFKSPMQLGPFRVKLLFVRRDSSPWVYDLQCILAQVWSYYFISTLKKINNHWVL